MDCPKHKIRLETRYGDYKTQQFVTVSPYCPLCIKNPKLKIGTVK